MSSRNTKEHQEVFGYNSDDCSVAESFDEEEFIRKETQNANRKGKRSGGFQVMGLSSNLLNAIVKKGYKVPTPIQRKAIPNLLSGVDVVAMARTGSGKSAAFIIPMLEKLKMHQVKTGARALILSPSRELALQIAKFTRDLGKYTDLRCAVVVGGDKLEEQFDAISSNPDIIIATPGRFIHLIVEMDLDLSGVEYLVFDEADRLFELGFSDSLQEIMFRIPSDSRQTCLFSATLPKNLVDFAKAGLKQPKLIRLDLDTKISPDLSLAFLTMNEVEKEAALLYLIRNIIDPSHQTIIFVSTKHHVEYLHEFLLSVGVPNSFIYGSLDQTARTLNLTKFRNGNTKYLVVTDVAARGIDIPYLNNVIHYDFCDKSKLFVHRSGRAARAGRTGTAYSFLTNDELPYLIDLQMFLGRQLILCENQNEGSLVQDVVLGDYPQSLYLDELDQIKVLLSTNSTLESLKKVSENGKKLYLKTRAQASKESYGRAKNIIETSPRGSTALGIHPIFKDVQSEVPDTQIFDQLRSYRPAETIFEIKKMGIKVGIAADLMKNRRLEFSDIIDRKKKQRDSNKEEANRGVKRSAVDSVNDDYLEDTFGFHQVHKKQYNTSPVEWRQTGAFRDDDYFVAATQKDSLAEKQYAITDSFDKHAAEAQMDVVADDTDVMRKQQHAMKFDKRKGKYVKTTVGADNKKMIRSESGRLLPASMKTDAFSKWKKNKRVSTDDKIGHVDTRLSSKLPKRYAHNQLKEGKPLDKLAYDYEKKYKKRQDKMKMALDGNHPAIDKTKAVVLAQKQKRVVNELKSADKITKERKIQEKRREKNARPARNSKLKFSLETLESLALKLPVTSYSQMENILQNLVDGITVLHNAYDSTETTLLLLHSQKLFQFIFSLCQKLQPGNSNLCSLLQIAWNSISSSSPPAHEEQTDDMKHIRQSLEMASRSLITQTSENWSSFTLKCERICLLLVERLNVLGLHFPNIVESQTTIFTPVDETVDVYVSTFPNDYPPLSRQSIRFFLFVLINRSQHWRVCLESLQILSLESEEKTKSHIIRVVVLILWEKILYPYFNALKNGKLSKKNGFQINEIADLLDIHMVLFYENSKGFVCVDDNCTSQLMNCYDIVRSILIIMMRLVGINSKSHEMPSFEKSGTRLDSSTFYEYFYHLSSILGTLQTLIKLGLLKNAYEDDVKFYLIDSWKDFLTLNAENAQITSIKSVTSNIISLLKSNAKELEYRKDSDKKLLPGVPGEIPASIKSFLTMDVNLQSLFTAPKDVSTIIMHLRLKFQELLRICLLGFEPENSLDIYKAPHLLVQENQTILCYGYEEKNVEFIQLIDSFFTKQLKVKQHISLADPAKNSLARDILSSRQKEKIEALPITAHERQTDVEIFNNDSIPNYRLVEGLSLNHHSTTKKWFNVPITETPPSDVCTQVLKQFLGSFDFLSIHKHESSLVLTSANNEKIAQLQSMKCLETPYYPFNWIKITEAVEDDLILEAICTKQDNRYLYQTHMFKIEGLIVEPRKSKELALIDVIYTNEKSLSESVNSAVFQIMIGNTSFYGLFIISISTKFKNHSVIDMVMNTVSQMFITSAAGLPSIIRNIIVQIHAIFDGAMHLINLQRLSLIEEKNSPFVNAKRQLLINSLVKGEGNKRAPSFASFYSAFI